MYVLTFLIFFQNLPAKSARFTPDIFALFSYPIHLSLWASEHLFKGLRFLFPLPLGKKSNKQNPKIFNVFISKVLKPGLKY